MCIEVEYMFTFREYMAFAMLRESLDSGSCTTPVTTMASFLRKIDTLVHTATSAADSTTASAVDIASAAPVGGRGEGKIVGDAGGAVGG